MNEYIVLSCLFFTMIFGLYLLGTAIVDNEESVPYRFVIGYLSYSFFVAVGGIVIQCAQLTWESFFWYMIIVLIILTCFTIYKLKKDKKKILPKGLKKIFANYSFLMIIVIMLLSILMFCYIALWFNNHLDDGFYINKMSILPYVKSPFGVIPSTGFIGTGSLNTYSFNTYELEASFYIYLTKCTPTLYARLFLSGFNYLLLVCSVYAFAEKVFDKMDIKFNKKILQFIPAIVLLFGFNEMFLKANNILSLQDSNQFINAMYYGSSVVRVIGTFLILVPFISKDKIRLKDVGAVVCIAVVLVSKSTIAIPIIVIISLAYLIATWIQGEKKEKIFAVVLILLIFIGGLLLNNNSIIRPVSNYALEIFTNNIQSPIIIGSLIIILISFILKKRIITKLNIIVIVSLLLYCCPILSNISSLSAFYNFVMGRVGTAIIYMIIVIAFMELYIFICSFEVKSILVYTLSLLVTMCLFLGSVYSTKMAGGNLFMNEQRTLSSLDMKASLSIILENKYFAPNSTIKLGEILKRLSETKDQQLNVVSRELEAVNGTAHPLATSITAFAPSVTSISAKFRYAGEVESNPFFEYTEEDQRCYEDFISALSEDTYQKFKAVLNKFPINCVVLPSKEYDKYMRKMDFELFDYVIDENAAVSYYVYER